MIELAFLKTEQSLRDHRKILEMAAALEMPEPHVVGHCIYLWLWAIDNAPSGTLPDNPRIIEKAAGWAGEPEQLVQAMLDARIIERNDEGQLIIHDWDEYTGKLIERRIEDKLRKRREKARKKDGVSEILRNSDGNPADVTRKSAPRVEKSREEKDKKHMCVLSTDESSFLDDFESEGLTDPTDEDKELCIAEVTGNASNRRTSLSDDYSEDFETFWGFYPRRIEKRKAYDVWKKRLAEKVDTDDMIIAAKHYALVCEQEGREASKIKHASTFLGPARSFEDYRSPPTHVFQAKVTTTHGASKSLENLRSLAQDVGAMPDWFREVTR